MRKNFGHRCDHDAYAVLFLSASSLACLRNQDNFWSKALWRATSSLGNQLSFSGCSPAAAVGVKDGHTEPKRVPPVAVGQKVSENKVTPAGMSPHNQVDAGEGTQLTGQAACQLVVMKVNPSQTGHDTELRHHSSCQLVVVEAHPCESSEGNELSWQCACQLVAAALQRREACEGAQLCRHCARELVIANVQVREAAEGTQLAG
eukprot:CAMPEP_0114249220 /NCGR_PEP_ID=MMETSP0058-20121206/14021_1 /TAXON_ID=36894 /ORGANISM="Pyramimonas parkeae, CCMP726" /LENGTH=203 /DNA_ID=CAMNT_0001362741 /DNA_START=391 /DNA_END=1002 /DNA_ORIENTATION=+